MFPRPVTVGLVLSAHALTHKLVVGNTGWQRAVRQQAHVPFQPDAVHRVLLRVCQPRGADLVPSATQ